MSELELEKLLEDCRQLTTKLKESDDRVVDLLGQSSKLSQKQRMIFGQKWFLEDIFADSEDGMQRRRLLDEFNDEYYKTELFIERNSILTDNLTDCLEVVKEIQERNRMLVDACKREKSFSKRSDFEVVSDESYGYAHAEAKDGMRRIANYVEGVLTEGEAEMRLYFEQYARDVTYVKGLKEIFRPAQLSHFNKLSSEGRSLLFSLFSRDAHFKEESEVVQPDADLQSSGEDEEHNRTTETMIYVTNKEGCLKKR